MEVRVIHVSTEGLTDPRQIGWVGYLEGDATVYAKVIRGRGKTPFLSLPTNHALGTTWPIVVYGDRERWKAKAELLLRRFKEEVGDDYFYNAQPRQTKSVSGLASATANQVP